MTYIKRFIGGVFIGVSNVIPGISGGTMAVVFNLYDQLIDALSLNIQSIKKNFWFLATIAAGIIAGILVFSNIMNYFLENFSNQTYGAFIGVVLGSIPIIVKKGNIHQANLPNMLSFVLFFSAMVVMWLLQDQQAAMVNVEQLTLPLTIGLFFAASIATVTMLVPGVSGSLLLIMIGYYHAIYTFTIRQFVFPQLIVVVAGMAFGLLVGAKIVSYLLKKYNDLIYAGILGLIVGSLFPLFPTMDEPVSTIITMCIAALLIYYFNKMNHH
jgi:putative membrane protein